MSRTWDIVDNVFSTNDLITRPQPSLRRLVPEVSSMLQLAVAVGLTTAAAISTTTSTLTGRLNATSEMRVVLQRSSVPLRRPPSTEKRRGVDFVRGCSAEKLANSFAGYFRPSTELDDSLDEGYVFN